MSCEYEIKVKIQTSDHDKRICSNYCPYLNYEGDKCVLFGPFQYRMTAINGIPLEMGGFYRLHDCLLLSEQE